MLRTLFCFALYFGGFYRGLRYLAVVLAIAYMSA